MTLTRENPSPRIMIVEDETVIALDLKSTLERFGYTVSGMELSGEKGIEVCEKALPDLVLMDIILQGKMDGIKAAEIIRSRWGIPVILLTAYGDQEQLKRAPLVHPFGYLIKPFREQDLKITLEMALYVSKVGAEKKMTEDAWQENQKLLERIFSSINEAVFIVDASTTKILNCNPAASILFGYSRDEMLGRTTAFLHVDEANLEEFRKALLSEVADRGHLFLPEFQMKRKDGRIFPTEHSVTPLEDERSRRIGWVSVVRDISERKKAGEALRRSEAKFRAIVENSHEGFLFCDANSKIIYRSPSFTRFYGFTDEERVGHAVFDVVHPEDLKEIRRYWDRVVQNPGIPLKTEYRIRHKNGTWRWVEPTAQNWLDNPDIQAIVITSIDITERKQTEAALRESQENFRLISETIDEVFWLADREIQRIFYISPGYEKVWGRSLKSLYEHPQSFIEAIHPEDRDQVLADYEVKHAGVAIDHEYRVIRPDGSVRWIWDRGFPLREDTGTVTRYVGIAQDITERKKVEESLRSSEEKFFKIFQTIPDPVSIIRLSDGIFLDVNESFTRVTGYPREDVVGHPYYSSDPDVWIHQKDRARLVATLIETGEVHGIETRFRGKGGHMIHGLISARALEINGEPCIVGIVNDITEQKGVEEALIKSRERLRALSARIQSVREEERSNISREIHDDLGQLLTGLKMDLSWILRHPNPDLAELKKKAQAMGKLIDQTVQTVRRISTELRPRILDDFGLAAALEWQAKEFTKKTEINCFFRSAGRQFDLRPDLSIAVFRIFQEALTNVVRHSEATKVDASLKKDAKGLVLTIQDNGRGISEEEIAQPHSLGLVGMRERALILGGTIEIKGKKGKGTRVILRLPLTK
jgi:PAS domain S-box-containing protein